MLNPALTELSAVATDDGAPVDGGPPMGAALALTAANSTPGECLSVARYRFLHHSAVSFVSSDIRVFGRGSRNHVTRDARKRQRKEAVLLLTAHANTGAST